MSWMRLVPNRVEIVLTNYFGQVMPKAAEFPARGNEAVWLRQEAFESVEVIFGSLKQRKSRKA